MILPSECSTTECPWACSLSLFVYSTISKTKAQIRVLLEMFPKVLLVVVLVQDFKCSKLRFLLSSKVSIHPKLIYWTLDLQNLNLSFWNFLNLTMKSNYLSFLDCRKCLIEMELLSYQALWTIIIRQLLSNFFRKRYQDLFEATTFL